MLVNEATRWSIKRTSRSRSHALPLFRLAINVQGCGSYGLSYWSVPLSTTIEEMVSPHLFSSSKCDSFEYMVTLQENEKYRQLMLNSRARSARRS